MKKIIYILFFVLIFELTSFSDVNEHNYFLDTTVSSGMYAGIAYLITGSSSIKASKNSYVSFNRVLTKACVGLGFTHPFLLYRARQGIITTKKQLKNIQYFHWEY